MAASRGEKTKTNQGGRIESNKYPNHTYTPPPPPLRAHRPPRTPLRFASDCMREAQVHGPVTLPVFGTKLEMLDEHVTERPQRAIREAVVVAFDVRVIEPHAVNRVLRILRRHLNAPRLVAHVAVRGARSPGHPRAVRVAHRGIERGHESTRRLLDLDPVRAAHVLVRLAIRDEDELAIVQIMNKVEHGVSMLATGMPRRYVTVSCKLAHSHLPSPHPSDARRDDGPYDRALRHTSADTNRLRRRMDRRAAVFRA